MSESPLAPEKVLLFNIFKLLGFCLILGMAYGYLFIEIPMVSWPQGEAAKDTTYLSIAIGFIYGAALGFIASSLLLVNHFLQRRKPV